MGFVEIGTDSQIVQAQSAPSNEVVMCCFQKFASGRIMVSRVNADDVMELLIPEQGGQLLGRAVEQTDMVFQMRIILTKSLLSDMPLYCFVCYSLIILFVLVGA